MLWESMYWMDIGTRSFRIHRNFVRSHCFVRTDYSSCKDCHTDTENFVRDHNNTGSVLVLQQP